MTFYACTIVLAELLMLTMTLHVAHYHGFTRRQKAWYILTFVATMVCAAAEFCVHGIPYDPAWAIPLTIVTVVQFSLAPVLAVLFSGSLGLERQERAAVAFLSLSVAVEVLCAPFGVIFSFTPQGYVRGPSFAAYEALFSLSLVYLVHSLIVVGRRFRRRDNRTISMVMVVLVAGILPMAIGSINVTYIAIAIAASLCYIYYNDLVQQDVQRELVRNQARVQAMQESMIFGMASLIENRDAETGEHIIRTRAYVYLLAEHARADGVYTDELSDHFISLLHTLAPLHDVGKIVVSDQILRKPGRLTPEEFEQMKQHAAMGGRVVREVLAGVTDEEYLEVASDIATYHHEWWDGTGYPEGLAGEDIPLCARIMAVADVFDALVSERCYKKPMPPKKAFAIIESESGTHFDPRLAHVFIEHKDDFLALALAE